MIKRHTRAALILCLFVSVSEMTFAVGRQYPSISHKDFKRLEGAWQGSLTYLDYSSGKPYTMPANVEIRRIGNTAEYSWKNIYPDEPRANSADTVVISSDGRYVDDEFVVSNEKLADGSWQIVTEARGRDGNDNKEALIRHTYRISKNNFKVRKDVQFAGEQNWIMRHEYAYTR